MGLAFNSLAKLILFNSLLAIAVILFPGPVVDVFAADKSYISFAIMLMYLYVTVSYARDCIAAGKGKLIQPWRTRQVVDWMLSLGLIGTLVGMIMAFTQMDLDAVKNADGAFNLATVLVAGMGTAMSTTLVGAVSNLACRVSSFIIRGDE